jgi:hypothetical protein
MFWAMDEYAESRSYFDRRGYYNTQNLNAADNHPNPTQRVRSIMDQQSVGYARFEVSPSALEMIGWRDSDRDGIFDVLDVPLNLNAETTSQADGRILVRGTASAQTLPNQNPAGNGNDISLNHIDQIEYRLDGRDWIPAAGFGDHSVEFEFTVQLPPGGADLLELRAVDRSLGITSAIRRWEIDPPLDVVWQNPESPQDVNGDGAISPLDALLVINDLNRNGSRSLAGTAGGPPFLDVNGDSFVTAIDALLIINRLNDNARRSSLPLDDGNHGEGEPDRCGLDSNRIVAMAIADDEQVESRNLLGLSRR